MASVPRHDTVVFLGPSLSHKRARDILDADFVPPVQAGDVHRLLATDVRRIVVIDGLFHGARSVWHRELIDALDEGIEVIGASSMGALRAAELCEDGMRGVGTVFEWYRSGAIDGDDEVALLHADGELGYRAMSEPLVNVRATLDDAVAAKEIDADEGARLLARARALPYAERAYPRLVQGEEEAQRARIAAALKARRRDLKAEDARAALKLCAASPTRPRGAIKTLRKELRRWLRRFHDEIHLTTNFVTHDLEEALEIADEVVIMNKARIEQVGTPQQVYDRPASPFVYQFIGNVNVLHAPTMVAAGVQLGGGIEATPEGVVYVRPHDIEISPYDPACQGLPAVLRYIHSAGSQARLILEQIQSRETIEVETSRSEIADLGLKVNDLVLLHLRRTHSFDDDYAI